MNEFSNFLELIIDIEKKNKIEALLTWVNDNFSYLTPKIAWNQPIFLDHGTFIIGFSYSAKHISIAIEIPHLERFKNSILQNGYKCSKALFYIGWNEMINFSLLKEIIQYIIFDKKDCNSFWQK